ncbi:hypothetical protein JHK85_006902 [Glycine max]|nr:hypothetical protein JHK85_006902 [Glycine max]KAG5071493.1 hypothetical protein JHK86_006704 [Glycine max]
MDKINPALVALMVHQYLRDNHFSQTSSIFLNEASSLFTDSSTNQLSKTMLGLVQILDEYMCLKKQKEMLHQQRVMVIQEKYRLQMFVQGLQNVINTFQKPLSLNVVGMSTNSAVVPQWRLCNETPSAIISCSNQHQSQGHLLQHIHLAIIHTYLLLRFLRLQHVMGRLLPLVIESIAHNPFSPLFNPIEIIGLVWIDARRAFERFLFLLCIGSAMQNTFGNFSTPMISVSDKKRKDTEIVNGPAVGKKPRGRPPGRKNQVQGQNTLPQSSNVVNNQVVSWQSSSSTLPPSGICAPNGSQVQGSNVAKGSFNHPLFFVPNHSQILETPPRTQSSHFMFDPEKQMAYKESSHCNSPIEADTGKASKKDDVRGKLNFDASNMPESLDKSLANEVSTSELDKGVVISDIDFSNLDWSLQGTSFEDFFDPIGLTDSKDNASSSRSSNELQVSTNKNLNVQGNQVHCVFFIILI